MIDPVGISVACAWALDLGVGDPRWLPHPVRGLGWLIARGELLLRRLCKAELWAGTLLVLAVGGIAWGGVSALLRAAGSVSTVLEQVVGVALLFSCFSTRDLAVETRPVYEALRAGDLPAARSRLRWIVGRETDRLDEPEIVRAAVETVAESAMDGIVAPLFWAAVAGVPGACLYKAINTLDSMVGFRSSRYIRFGRAAARLDTWANWVPAHLTAVLTALAAPPVQKGSGTFWTRVWQSLRAAYRDPAVRRENSWLVEAAMAGALGVRLGGENTYEGRRWTTPLMGRPVRPLAPERIPESLRVMFLTSGLALGAALLFRTLWRGLLG